MTGAQQLSELAHANRDDGIDQSLRTDSTVGRAVGRAAAEGTGVQGRLVSKLCDASATPFRAPLLHAS